MRRKWRPRPSPLLTARPMAATPSRPISRASQSSRQPSQCPSNLDAPRRMTDDQLLRYSRHILLDEVGIEGQQSALAATALVIGAGGLGSPAAMYLAASGVGRIVLVDDDDVDLTNLQRQIMHTTA